MTDHAHELRRHARKIGHPAGDIPAVMHAAAEHIEELERRLRKVEKEAARWRGIKQRHSVALVRLATGSGSYSSGKASGLLDAWADMAAAEVDAFDPDAYLAEVDARIAEFERPMQPPKNEP